MFGNVAGNPKGNPMRKIEKQIIDAINNGANLQTGNTTVTHDPVIDGSEMELHLHGHLIAKQFKNGSLEICLAGWDTRTTRGRLSLVIRNAVDRRIATLPAMTAAQAVTDSRGPFRYPSGLGVSSRKNKHGKNIVRIHDARGETIITNTEWHKVML